MMGLDICLLATNIILVFEVREWLCGGRVLRQSMTIGRHNSLNLVIELSWWLFCRCGRYLCICVLGHLQGLLKSSKHRLLKVVHFGVFLQLIDQLLSERGVIESWNNCLSAGSSKGPCSRGVRRRFSCVCGLGSVLRVSQSQARILCQFHQDMSFIGVVLFKGLVDLLTDSEYA